MEDAHMGIPLLDLPETSQNHQRSSFFGVQISGFGPQRQNELFALHAESVTESWLQVFDGHGGVEAAHFARDNLLDLVLGDTSFSSHPGLAMVRSF